MQLARKEIGFCFCNLRCISCLFFLNKICYHIKHVEQQNICKFKILMKLKKSLKSTFLLVDRRMVEVCQTEGKLIQTCVMIT